MSAKYDGPRFRERFGAWAVVAGGSDGIGREFAREAARRGLDVALAARREAPLRELASELEAEHGVQTRTVIADLTSETGLAGIADATAALDVGLFIHNAGSSPRAAAFLDQSRDDAMFMLNLNCRAPAMLAHHFGTRLRERGRGGIVLMSSLASLAGSAYQAVYAATKAFDTTLAEGLWHELAPAGVDVLGVLAGATRTETMLAQQPEAFEQTMDPSEVARGALDHLGKGPNWIPGDGNRAAAKGMWPVPRVALINGMSQAGADLFGLPYTAVEGVEFDED